MKNTPLRYILIALIPCLLMSGCESTRMDALPELSRATMKAQVDARELPRGFLHCRMQFHVQPGHVAFWFPKWIPGTHGPTSRIRNLAHLHFETSDGAKLTWKRDEVDLFRFLVEVPKDIFQITAHLSYLCNQSTDSSRPIDSHGGTPIGVINWNTCLLYPEKRADDELNVQLSLTLPENWRYASALKTKAPALSNGQPIQFDTTTLRDVIDSPLIAGKHFISVPLRTEGGPPVHLHVVSEPAEGININEDFKAGCSRLVTEAEALLGPPPYKAYHFLVVSTDFIRSTGLEHVQCSLNGVRANALTGKKQPIDRPAHLLPHEYVHAWVGKYRRPQGMFTRDFHSPKRTRLLWVYEGLTQYLGYVLAARSGLSTKSEILERLAQNVDYLQRRTGRGWRPLIDTAVANYTLRGGIRQYEALRRGQDYYTEGALFWLEADIIIRATTLGKKSLDDFCKSFFSAHAQNGEISPFTHEDIVAALNKAAPFDWQKLIETRIHNTQESLSLNAIHLAGYRPAHRKTPGKKFSATEKRLEIVRATGSIGVGVRSSGKIYSLEKNSPAYRAGLGHDMYIMQVGDEKYSAKLLQQAIADSPKTGKIDLVIWDRGEFREVSITYNEGPKYLFLERDDSRPDLLKWILKPRVSQTQSQDE